MADGEKLQDFQKIFRDFLDFREWDDEIESIESTEKWMISTTIRINEQSAKLFIEGNDESGVLGIFIYYDIKCKENKQPEMVKLFNWTNQYCFTGHLQCLSDGTLRWKNQIDCEGATMTGFNLSVNFQHGWNIVERYADAINSVALTKISAEEAIEEFNEALAAAAAAEDNTPDEL
jgi:hypothetical protein